MVDPSSLSADARRYFDSLPKEEQLTMLKSNLSLQSLKELRNSAPGCRPDPAMCSIRSCRSPQSPLISFWMSWTQNDRRKQQKGMTFYRYNVQKQFRTTRL